MRCRWLRVDNDRLIDLGEHEQLPHLAEVRAPQAAAKLKLGQTVHYPATDDAGLTTIKNALAWVGITVKHA